MCSKWLYCFRKCIDKDCQLDKYSQKATEITKLLGRNSFFERRHTQVLSKDVEPQMFIFSATTDMSVGTSEEMHGIS
jgi:hypothetical protein